MKRFKAFWDSMPHFASSMKHSTIYFYNSIEGSSNRPVKKSIFWITVKMRDGSRTVAEMYRPPNQSEILRHLEKTTGKPATIVRVENPGSAIFTPGISSSDKEILIRSGATPDYWA